MTMTAAQAAVLDAVRRLKDASDWAGKGHMDMGRARRAIADIKDNLPPDLRGMLEFAFEGLLERVEALTSRGYRGNSKELSEAWRDLASAVRGLFP